MLPGKKHFQTIDYFEPPHQRHEGNDAVPHPFLEQHPKGRKDDQ